MDYKEKQNKINRALYVTVAAILCMTAVVIAVTTSANRARKRDLESQRAPVITSAPAVTTAKPVTTAPAPVTEPAPPETEPDPSADAGVNAEVPPDDGGQPVNAEPLDALPVFVLPAEGVISTLHDLTTPVYSITMNDYRTHRGIDISSALGAPVYAAADGVISQIWEEPMMGVCVSIAHSGGALSVYKNLADEIPVGIEPGVEVRAGQLIAAVGESAWIEIALEPHLHYELMVDGTAVNPLDYFGGDAKMTSAQVDSEFEG